MKTKTLRTLQIASLVVLSAMVVLAMPAGASDLNYDPTGSDFNPMSLESLGVIPCSDVCPAPDDDIYTISSPCDGVDITVRDAFLVSDRYQVWVDGVLIGTTPTETCGGSVYSKGTFRVFLTTGDHTLQFKNTCEPCFTGSAPCYNGWLPSRFYYKVEIVDTTPPVITCPADVTVEQETAAGTVVPLTATATDICDASPTITSDELAIYPLGTTTVTFTATDDSGNSASCSMTVTVQDTTPPVITCPADVTVEQETAAGTVVPLTATATDICDVDVDITSDAPAIFPLGMTTVTFTATDDSGNTATCTTTVTVIDTIPPDISVTVSPDTLWPPNHKMVDITATVTVSDICDPDLAVVLTSVTSNEPDDVVGNGDGKTVDDIQGADTGTEDYEFQLRAERAGEGDGRVYTITYTVTDASGNSASASGTVVVPHDRD